MSNKYPGGKNGYSFISSEETDDITVSADFDADVPAAPVEAGQNLTEALSLIQSQINAGGGGGGSYTASDGVKLVSNNFSLDPTYSPTFVDLTLSSAATERVVVTSPDKELVQSPITAAELETLSNINTATTIQAQINSITTSLANYLLRSNNLNDVASKLTALNNLLEGNDTGSGVVVRQTSAFLATPKVKDSTGGVYSCNITLENLNTLGSNNIFKIPAANLTVAVVPNSASVTQYVIGIDNQGNIITEDANLQTIFNNSTSPQILVNGTPFNLKNGVSDDTVAILVITAFDNNNYFSVKANGEVTATSVDSITGTLNLGADADVINLGNASATINFIGNTEYENVTNLQVADKLITLNKGGGTSSAINAGIEIEENNAITGYFYTTGNRNGWQFKSPNRAGTCAFLTPTVLAGNGTVDYSNLTGNRTYTAQDASGTVALGTFGNSLFFTTTGDTNVTLPTAGTLLANDGEFTGNMNGGTIGATTPTQAQIYRPIKFVTATAYTLILEDNGTFISLNNSSAIILTIPNSSTVAFIPAKTEITIAQRGVGQVTIVGEAGVTILGFNGYTKTAGQIAAVTLLLTSANTWELYGNLTS